MPAATTPAPIITSAIVPRVRAASARLFAFARSVELAQVEFGHTACASFHLLRARSATTKPPITSAPPSAVAPIAYAPRWLVSVIVTGVVASTDVVGGVVAAVGGGS